MAAIQLDLRSGELVVDSSGSTQWRQRDEAARLSPRKTALLLCDVWDDHTSRGAVERLEAMVPAMAAVVAAMRGAGVTIVHCPSDCMAFYAGTPARERVLGTAAVVPPLELEHEDPPLPIDAEGPFSDTDEPAWRGSAHAVANDWYGGRDRPWSRQHPGVEIDHARDGISDDGAEVYSFLRARGVGTVLVMGVHINMCVLHRSFGIKQLTRWGLRCVLLRDLTDAMYNPARPPYVSHDEGTRLVVRFVDWPWARGLFWSHSRAPMIVSVSSMILYTERAGLREADALVPPPPPHPHPPPPPASFIEKFWCPSALGAQLLTPRRDERWTRLRAAAKL
jgi:nicotinamidase-related amidase